LTWATSCTCDPRDNESTGSNTRDRCSVRWGRPGRHLRALTPPGADALFQPDTTPVGDDEFAVFALTRDELDVTNRESYVVGCDDAPRRDRAFGCLHPCRSGRERSGTCFAVNAQATETMSLAATTLARTSSRSRPITCLTEPRAVATSRTTRPIPSTCTGIKEGGRVAVRQRQPSCALRGHGRTRQECAARDRRPGREWRDGALRQ